jgi:ubiquinone biosynthesis protein
MIKNSVQRLNEIVRILAFYGFGYFVDSKLNKEQKSPQNLRKAFEELGPTFIKIGQILSTRPDLVPSSYINELVKLQDRVGSESFDAINKVFSEEFNEAIEDVFLYFDKTPLASASIAQVHKAVLKTGKEVIVKIQRPEIAEKMRLDLSILIRIARLTKARFADSLIDPEEALQELLESTERELDFNNEAENSLKFRNLNKNVAFLTSPYLYEDLCSSRVLTMEKIDGFKITDIEKLEEGGYDLEDLSQKLVLSFFKQIFEDSFFHGDPHPGNIFICEGKICYLDFGIMGHLSKSLKQALNDIIVAVAYMDINKIISVLMSIGIKKGHVNRNKLYEDIDYLLASYLSTSLQNIKMSMLLDEIFDVAKRNNIKLPKDLTLLIRSLILVEGLVVKLTPDMNLMEIAIPYVKSSNKLSILDEFNLDEFLLRSFSFTKDLMRVPNKFIDLSESIINGRAKMQLEIKNLSKSVNDLNKMVNRMVFGLVASSLIIGSSYILSSNVGPKIYDISIIGILGFSIAAFMGLWLIISILKSGKM